MTTWLYCFGIRLTLDTPRKFRPVQGSDVYSTSKRPQMNRCCWRLLLLPPSMFFSYYFLPFCWISEYDIRQYHKTRWLSCHVRDRNERFSIAQRIYTPSFVLFYLELLRRPSLLFVGFGHIRRTNSISPSGRISDEFGFICMVEYRCESSLIRNSWKLFSPSLM